MTNDLIPLILSAGGGAFVLAVVQGWREARAGIRGAQRETVEDLMRWRDDLDRKLSEAAQDRDYWRDLAATRGHQLRAEGVEPSGHPAVPPSARPNPEGGTS